MDPTQRRLDEVEGKIARLKREYDLCLAGERRGLPTALRNDIERTLLRLTRSPLLSTATRFRAQSLAHRFQALETQVRHLQEQKESRRTRAGRRDEGDAAVVLDRTALNGGPGADRYVQRLHRTLAALCGDRPVPPYERFRDRILAEVRRQLERPAARAVRFTVTDGDDGPRIRGEVLVDART